MFSAVAHITLVGDSSGTLEKMSEKFGSALMKRKGRLFDAFRKGLGSDIELIDVRMEQSLSIYVGCQSRKSVHRLDKAFQSGRLLNVLRECTSCVVDEADVINIQWDASDFNRCIQYFHNLSGERLQRSLALCYVLWISQGGFPSGKPEKVSEFDTGQGKVWGKLGKLWVSSAVLPQSQ